ncbi:hypothetical protein DXB40_12860, partial [Bacteroides sp. 4_1_36]
GRDCNGFTDYRHFNQNPCNSILSLYLSAFHFFVVTLRRIFIIFKLQTSHLYCLRQHTSRWKTRTIPLKT